MSGKMSGGGGKGSFGARETGIRYLDVSGIKNAANKFRSKVEDFDNCVTMVDRQTNLLLYTWTGKGRNQFETQMELMKSQLEDISDILYEIYDALVGAEEGYIEVDEETSKQFRSQ